MRNPRGSGTTENQTARSGFAHGRPGRGLPWDPRADRQRDVWQRVAACRASQRRKPGATPGRPGEELTLSSRDLSGSGVCSRWRDARRSFPVGVPPAIFDETSSSSGDRRWRRRIASRPVHTDLPAKRGQPLLELVGMVEDLDRAIARSACERPLHGRRDRPGDHPLMRVYRRQLIDNKPGRSDLGTRRPAPRSDRSIEAGRARARRSSTLRLSARRVATRRYRPG
jgi:hypothetical protein